MKFKPNYLMVLVVIICTNIFSFKTIAQNDSIKAIHFMPDQARGFLVLNNWLNSLIDDLNFINSET